MLTDGKKTIKVRHGLQVRQYRDQLHEAGFLNKVIAARGLDRHKLLAATNALVRDLRVGALVTRTRENAAHLGLSIYPDHN